MNIKNSFFIILSCLLLLILAGCARYQARPLGRLFIEEQTPKSPAVSFAYHVLSPAECKMYLDTNLIAQGYQPIHITLTNNSDHGMHMSPGNFNVPTVPYVEVAQKAHYSPVKRAVGYGIPGLFIWPFLIPAVVDTINAIEANNQIDMDFYFKSLRNQTIQPFSTVNGLIFVPVGSVDTMLSVTVIDIETKQHYVLSANQPYAKIK